MSKFSFTQKVIVIAVLILLLGSLTFAVIQTIGKSKWQKNAGDWKTNYYACMNAPVKEVVIHDSIVVNKIVYIPLKPVTYEAKTDTLEKPCTATYTDVYRFTQGEDFGRFRFKFSVTDCRVEGMEVSEAVWPKEIVIRTKQVDTCISKPPLYIPKSHWGLFGGANINSFKRFPGLDLNIIYMYKDKWGLYGGVAYINPNKAVSDAMGDVSIWNNMYLRVGGMIYFK
jgi:hypothetical protein